MLMGKSIPESQILKPSVENNDQTLSETDKVNCAI